MDKTTVRYCRHHNCVIEIQQDSRGKIFEVCPQCRQEQIERIKKKFKPTILKDE